MARRQKLEIGELFEVATYFTGPKVRTEIHAELPHGHRVRFEQEYVDATCGYPLPVRGNDDKRRAPYYVWPEGTNKHGRELRIYFARVAPEPPLIRTLYTDFGKWYARSNRYRINHSNLVMQLFECGFVLGMNDKKGDRIAEFMRRKFPA